MIANHGQLTRMLSTMNSVLVTIATHVGAMSTLLPPCRRVRSAKLARNLEIAEIRIANARARGSSSDL